MRARNYTTVASWLLLAASCGPPGRNPDTNCADTDCVCIPGELYCDGPQGNDVYRCNDEGTGGSEVMQCPADQACSEGACKTPCEAAEDNPSNLGCDFWAVDLDNEAVSILGGVTNDAAAQQFAVVAANNNDFPVVVTVTRNTARVGEPLAEQAVLTMAVAPRVAQRIDLPQAEVDGSMGQHGAYTRNSGSGTFVSPHGYHITSTGPVVVYQFNPIIQQYSNDASTLIPRNALGTDYIAIGYETANPCGISMLPQESIPDHGEIAILASEDDTHVIVTASHPIAASAGDSGFPIAATPKGGTLTFTTGRYTVVNLESQQMTGTAFDCMNAVNNGQDGDFTGTYIKADKPIAVFTASERGAGFGGASNVIYPPDWDPQSDDTCCTDHLEEQLLPVTALGKEFAVARSPIRSTYPTWVEPDIVRVVGSQNGTTITTNLDPPYDHFVVNQQQKVTFAATRGFTINADQPISVSSYLVSQHFVKQGFIGDPSQLLIPAAEQHRKDYVFLVPATFEKNYAVFAKPVDAQITLDGMPLDSVEFSTCTKAPIGTLDNIQYEQVTCLLPDGHHQASADKPFGLSVYGYYNVGSYAFIGGSDIKIINPIE